MSIQTPAPVLQTTVPMAFRRRGGKAVIVLPDGTRAVGAPAMTIDNTMITVTPELRFEVSRRIREEFDNGKHYYESHGQQIIVPGDPTQRPDARALRWHNEQCFKG